MFMGWTEFDKRISFDRMVVEAVHQFKQGHDQDAAVIVTAENFRDAKAPSCPQVLIRVGKRPMPQTYLIWVGNAEELVEAV